MSMVHTMNIILNDFRWDWGPAFASMGIWKPIYLVGSYASFSIDELLWKTELIEDEWAVEVTMIFGKLGEGHSGMEGTIHATVRDSGNGGWAYTHNQCE